MSKTDRRRRAKNGIRRPFIQRLESRMMLAGDWQNPILPMDVNGDGVVSSLDPLQIINDLGRYGERKLPALAGDSGAVPRYLDTNGDDFVSAIDATLAIGAISRDANLPDTVAVEQATSSVGLAQLLASEIIDNGDSSYTETGSWGTVSNGGYNGNWRYPINPGDATATANWTFTGLDPGRYQVSATWRRQGNLSTAAPYKILADGMEKATVAVNQTIAPAADVVDGGDFQHLGLPVTITGTTLMVSLGTAASGFVGADAVRIEMLAPAGPDTTPPTADLADPLNGATVDLVVINDPPPHIDVTFSDLESGIDPSTIDGDELMLSGAAAAGVTIDGTASLVSGTTYRYALTGAFVEGLVVVDFVGGSFADLAGNLNLAETESFTVQAFQSQIIDNLDPEYSETGSWATVANGGYDGNWRYPINPNDMGATASWTFSGLSPGEYQVSATWRRQGNLSTVAPYTILDGTTELATVDVNQTIAPAADVVDGGNFQFLGGTVTIIGDTLVVRLGTAGPAYVGADAVRIERVDVPPPVVFAYAVSDSTDLFGSVDASGKFNPIGLVRTAGGTVFTDVENLATDPTDQTIYAVDDGTSLITIDPATGIALTEVPTVLTDIDALTFNSAGELFAIDVVDGGGPGDLVQLNKATGEVISRTPLIKPTPDPLAGYLAQVDGIVFDPQDPTQLIGAYSYWAQQSFIVDIDPDTGVMSNPIASGVKDIEDLSVNDEVIYGVLGDTGAIIAVNPASGTFEGLVTISSAGVATPVGSFGTPPASSCYFQDDGCWDMEGLTFT